MSDAEPNLTCGLCESDYSNVWSQQESLCPDCRNASPGITDYQNEAADLSGGGSDE
jgi:hypothetical protein